MLVQRMSRPAGRTGASKVSRHVQKHTWAARKAKVVAGVWTDSDRVEDTVVRRWSSGCWIELDGDLICHRDELHSNIAASSGGAPLNDEVHGHL